VEFIKLSIRIDTVLCCVDFDTYLGLGLNLALGLIGANSETGVHIFG